MTKTSQYFLRLDTPENSKLLYFNTESKNPQLKSTQQTEARSGMRSFSRVPLIEMGPNEFQEERQRLRNDGKVERDAKRILKKERERESCLNLTSHFHCEIVGAEVTRGQKKTRGYVHILFFSARGERPRKGKSTAIRVEDREARLPPGDLRTRNRKGSEIV